MKKKNKIQWNFYVEDLRQLKTIGVVVSIVLVIGILFAVWVLKENHYSFITYQKEEFLHYNLLTLGVPVAILPLMAAQLFAQINNRSSSDVYHSFPIKRSHMFAIHLAAALTWSVALFVGSALVGYVVDNIVTPPTALFEMEEYFEVVRWCWVAGLMITGVAVLGRTLSGNGKSFALMGGLILFGPRMVLLAMRYCIAQLNPSISLRGSLLWDSGYHIFFPSVDAIGNTAKTVPMWASLTYSTILALVYLGAAYYFYVTRKSEKVEGVTIGPKAQMVLRLVPAVLVCLVPMMLYYGTMVDGHGDDSMRVLCLIMYVIAIAAYFIMEIVTTRKLSSARRAARGLWVLLVVNFLMFGMIRVTVFYHSLLKPEVDEIDYIEVLPDEYGSFGQIGVFNMLLEKDRTFRLESDAAKTYFSDELKEAMKAPYGSFCGMEVKIHYNGKNIYRNLYIDRNTFYQLAKDEKVAKEYLTLENLPTPDQVENSNQAEGKWYTAYYEEVKEVGDERYRNLVLENPDATYQIIYIHDEDGGYKYNHYGVYIPILQELPISYRAYQWRHGDEY